MIISAHLLYYVFVALPFMFAGLTALIFFHRELYSRLSTRIAALIFASGLLALLILEAFNIVTSDTASPPWVRILQVLFVAVGGPVLLGLLAARFVRRPLRQFNKAIASLEQNNYKVSLRSTGIREFDEVFVKFNKLIERLRHEERLRKDLVSDASHELNTPLTSMIGQLTALHESKYPMTKERVESIKEQAERLAELVQQLDAYTKARIPDARGPEDVSLKQICRQLVGRMSTELKQREMQVEIDIPDDLVIYASRDALQKILTNLIQNTVRYSEATEVTIKATAHQLTFTDNGKGVPDESLPHLFERFYRVDESRSRETGGLGLGLAIVRELVEQQGWHIHAKAARPGLTFVMAFTS